MTSTTDTPAVSGGDLALARATDLIFSLTDVEMEQARKVARQVERIFAAPSPASTPSAGVGLRKAFAGAFVTTQSVGNLDPAKRVGVFNAEFRGEGAAERAQRLYDILAALAADHAPGERGGAEPVFWVLHTEANGYGNYHFDSRAKCQDAALRFCKEDSWEVRPLYIAPPPMTPDSAALREAVHKLTRPLAVDSMDQAVRTLLTQLEPGKRAAQTTDEQWARHLAWIIGFDTLTEERARLHALVPPVTAPAKDGRE